MHIIVTISIFDIQGRDVEQDPIEEEVPEITQWEAIGWLAILTLWISILSGYLVDAIQVEFLFAPFDVIQVHLLISIWGYPMK